MVAGIGIPLRRRRALFNKYRLGQKPVGGFAKIVSALERGERSQQAEARAKAILEARTAPHPKVSAYEVAVRKGMKEKGRVNYKELDRLVGMRERRPEVQEYTRKLVAFAENLKGKGYTDSQIGEAMRAYGRMLRSRRAPQPNSRQK